MVLAGAQSAADIINAMQVCDAIAMDLFFEEFVEGHVKRVAFDAAISAFGPYLEKFSPIIHAVVTQSKGIWKLLREPTSENFYQYLLEEMPEAVEEWTK